MSFMSPDKALVTRHEMSRFRDHEDRGEGYPQVPRRLRLWRQPPGAFYPWFIVKGKGWCSVRGLVFSLLDHASPTHVPLYFRQLDF